MDMFYHLLLLSLLLPLCSCTDPLGNYCSKSFNGSQTQANIDHVLADLVERAPIGGFATSSYGKDNKKSVYGLAQCRGDVNTEDCSTCISDAAKKLLTLCPYQADARIWYDNCFVRYDTSEFIGKADTSYSVILFNVENATDPEIFDKEVGRLMDRVRAQAVVPGNEGSGSGKTNFRQNVTIYGLADCTRDLQQLDCAQCLASAVAKFPDYCQYRKGCRVLYSSCFLGYEIYPFYFPLD